MLNIMVKSSTFIPNISEEHFELARESFKYANMSEEDKYRISNWFKYDGSLYYLKYISDLNEFIGEYLAKYLKLKSAHYMPVKRNGSIFVASRNFRFMDCDYLNYYELPKDIDILEDIEFSDIRSSLFKMFSLDIYMRQRDRSYVNFMFLKDTTGKLSLAPVYDYSYSFSTSNYKVYDNSIMDIPMNREKVAEICNKYPELYDYLIQISSVDMEDILRKICSRYDLELKDEVKTHYLEEDEISKKMLKKVL